MYFQVPVTVENFNATLNDTNFLLRQNCVVTILLEDKCVSDPLVDLCDSNYTRPGQQAIWWEIQYPPLEGGEACPGSGDPIDPYYVDCVNYDCDRDCNETCPTDWSDCLDNDGVVVECEEEGVQNKTCQIHTPSQYNGIACTTPLWKKCIGLIPSPFCDCDNHVLDSCGVCDGECCPIGQLRDSCGICNGTDACKDEQIRLDQERHQNAVFLGWSIPLGVIFIAFLLILLLLRCCECTLTTQKWNEDNQRKLAEAWEKGIKNDGYGRENYDKWKQYEYEKLNTYQFTDVENLKRVQF